MSNFLLEHARAQAGVRLYQGRRRIPLYFGSTQLTEAPALKFLTENRVRRVPDRAVLALLRWLEGFPVEVRYDVPIAQHVLWLQASGGRCVSLLPKEMIDTSGKPLAPFDFALHDLCHLEKFADARYHAEQVGFFSSLKLLLADSRWRTVEEQLDAEWKRDRDRVCADTNGSSIYLFAVLKMRLKMAARRLKSRRAGELPPTSGRLSPEEQSVFEPLEEELCEGLGFPKTLFEAAMATSARRDDPRAAALVAAEFRRRGEDALARQSKTQ